VQSGFSQGQPASLRLFFEIGMWVFFVIGPAVSMRTISEELRLGTFETLMTAPVSEAEVILGKFFGSLGFLVLVLLPTAVYVIALEWYGRPDYGEVMCGYLGLLLVGAAYLATGIFASTLTSSQVLAYLMTVFFWLILLLTTMGLPLLASWTQRLPVGGGEPGFDWLGGIARFSAQGNPLLRARGFVIGLVDTFNIVYFLGFTVVFLVAAAKSLGLRRWA